MLQARYDSVVLEHYPEARDAKDVSITYLGRMQTECGLDASRTLMATSLCSDDINIPATTFFSNLFGPFFMGGLGGLPFSGETGMTAFAHHVPDKGSAFLFYGPHIGVTMDGDLGKMYRPRQEKPGASCGALMLALSRFQADPAHKPTIRPDDYQQGTLEALLAPYAETFLAAENPAKAITEAAYKLIDRKVHEYVHKCRREFKVDRIALLGGVIVNTAYGMDDYLATRNFEVIDLTKDFYYFPANPTR